MQYSMMVQQAEHAKALAELRFRYLGESMPNATLVPPLPSSDVAVGDGADALHWTLCEGDWATQELRCEASKLLFVHSMRYHRPALMPCMYAAAPSANAVCAGQNIVRSSFTPLLQGPLLKFAQTPSALFGDPCPMIYKQIDVLYYCLTPDQLRAKLNITNPA